VFARVALVMDRRCWAGKIVDLVNLNVEWKRNVVPKELETLVAKQSGNIAFRAAEKIIAQSTSFPSSRSEDIDASR